MINNNNPVLATLTQVAKRILNKVARQDYAVCLQYIEENELVVSLESGEQDITISVCMEEEIERVSVFLKVESDKTINPIWIKFRAGEEPQNWHVALHDASHLAGNDSLPLLMA